MRNLDINRFKFKNVTAFHTATGLADFSHACKNKGALAVSGETLLIAQLNTTVPVTGKMHTGYTDLLGKTESNISSLAPLSEATKKTPPPHF